MQRVLSFPNTRSMSDPSEFVTKRMCCSFVFSVGFIFLLTGFLLGRFALDQELQLTKRLLSKSRQWDLLNGRKNYSEFDVALSFNDSYFQQYLNSLKKDHNVLTNVLVAREVGRFFQLNPFDVVSAPSEGSRVLLSYHDAEGPNSLVLLDERGVLQLECRDARQGTDMSSKVENDTNFFDGLKTSNEITGSTVYVNFGTNEDYHYLDSLNIDVRGHIVLARAGKIPPYELVNIAFEHEAKGVIIFQDPQQSDTILPRLTPYQLAKLQTLHGDSLAQVEGEWSSTQPTSSKPCVPVMIISSMDAEKIFRAMSGKDPSPQSWRGTLNTSYPIGPGFSRSGWSARLSVRIVNKMTKYYNVFGALRGKDEHDRIIVMSTDTELVLNDGEPCYVNAATLLEVARVLIHMKTEYGWQPHRTIVFAFWGLSRHEEIMEESVREWWQNLKGKTVAYITLGLTGKDSKGLHVNGSPALRGIVDRIRSVVTSSQRVVINYLPKFGEDSHLIEKGIPYLQIQQEKSFTKKHFDDDKNLIASMLGVLTWNLADKFLLPLDGDAYVDFFNHSVAILNGRYESIAKQHTLFLDSLTNSVKRFIEAWKKFKKTFTEEIDFKIIEGRIINDRMLAMINSLGCPSDKTMKLNTRHAIFSRGESSYDPTSGFGVLQDLLREMTSVHAPDDLHQQIISHISQLVNCIDSARKALADELDRLLPPST